MDYRSEIDAALSNQGPISKDKVLLWIESVTDLPSLAKFEGRWEAARTLHLWLRQLLEMGDSSDEIEKTASTITDLFLTSGEEIQLAIEQGFLEHALESGGLRPYFERWSKDARLRKTWLAATEWAEDHPDWSWNLHQEFLKKIGDK